MLKLVRIDWFPLNEEALREITDEEVALFEPHLKRARGERSIGVLDSRLRKLYFLSAIYEMQAATLQVEAASGGNPEGAAKSREYFLRQSILLSDFFWRECLEAFPALWQARDCGLRRGWVVVRERQGFSGVLWKSAVPILGVGALGLLSYTVFRKRS